MHLHVTGAAARSSSWPPATRDRLFRAVVDEGALINAASTEEGGGSPARGAIPGTVAKPVDDGVTWRLTGEKTWTTWLPALRFALVSARVDGVDDPAQVAVFLVDLESPGVERLPGFEALGMRGSASGRLRLTDVEVKTESLVAQRVVGGADPRGPEPGAWFAVADLGGVPGSGGGRTRGGGALGARPTPRRRLDGRGGPPDHPASAGPD